MSRPLSEQVLDLALHRLETLCQLGDALCRTTDPREVHERLLTGAMALTQAEGGSLFLLKNRRLNHVIVRNDALGVAMGGTSGVAVTLPPIPLYDAQGRPQLDTVVAVCAIRSEVIVLSDVYDAKGYDFTATKAFDQRTRYRTQSMLVVPLLGMSQEAIGVLQLINARTINGQDVVPFSPIAVRIAESLGSQAAVVLSRQGLVDDMAGLFEGFVQLIADAIDAKSPYTGGHCRRVTEMTMLLAEAVAQHQDGPLAAFTLSDADRYELNIAALLHDCGKITTPEWVMDKATKLQCVHDRKEDIATRFAVLKQQAAVYYWQQLHQGVDEATAAAERDASCATYDQQWVLIERLNQGSEQVAEEDLQQIQALATQTWTDASGAERPLLSADELDNLGIRRGTLNQVERRIIEQHVESTISMLESLPYPAHLKRIPEFAGGHHERVDGSGYPRRLTGDQMSVQARIMAIADIFEALTAADRPYKDAMTLSQAMDILAGMARRGHIDADLFHIFVRSGVWRVYADHYLSRQQIDITSYAISRSE